MNKKLVLSALASIVSLSTLVGCGEEPVQQTATPAPQAQAQVAAPVPVPTVKASTAPKKTTTKKKAPTKTTTGTTATASTAPTTTTTTNTSTASNLSVEQKILQKVKQTYDSYKTFSSTLTLYSKRSEKYPKNSAVLNAKFKFDFQQPRIAGFKVLEHNITIAVGAQLLWRGGDKAKVKASILNLELPLDDTKLTTNRNWRFDQLDHISMLERAMDPKATLKLSGKSKVSGKDAYMIKVTGVKLDDEITDETIAIDVKDFTLLADEMYANNDLVFQIKLTMDSVNQPFPKELETL
ncbi:MAG: hypothetical protein ACK4IX_00750 [Candidatus Sericytochromatia bacterium]